MTDDPLRAALSGRDKTLRDRSEQVAGKFWRKDGSAWSGGVPVGGFSGRQEALNALEAAFAPIDVLSDLIAYHCDAVAGDWYVTVERPLATDEKPTEQERALIKRAEALLTSWWDEHDAAQTLRTALEPLLWANIRPPGERPLTVAPLRYVIPPHEAERDGAGVYTVMAATPEEASGKVTLTAPSPLQAGAVRDSAERVTAHVYSYRLADGLEYLEVCALGRDLYPDLTRYADLTFLEVRHGGEVKERAVYDLGGELLHNELLATRLLVTDSLLSEQRQLNTANTLKGINLRDHGFLQEDLVGVDIPGVWKNGEQEITQTEAENTPGARFHAFPIKKGPNLSRAWEGTPIYDATGKVVARSKPEVIRHQPSSSEEFRQSIGHSLDTMYLLARQLHRRLSISAAASGDARVEARSDFNLSLEPTKRAYEHAVQWALTTLLRLSALLANQTGMFDGLRVVCQAKKTVVEPTTERLRVYNEMRRDGQLDAQSHLELTGVSVDVDGTLARMSAEQTLREGTQERMALLLTLLEKNVITTEQLTAEAVKLGLVEGTVTT